MKKTIALLTTLITLVTLVVYISTASAASPAGCPTGYICTPTVPVAAVVCPVGYVCTPQSAASGSAATPTYVQGSFYRTYLSGAGSVGTTNTNISANIASSAAISTSLSTTTIVSNAVLSSSSVSTSSINLITDRLVAEAKASTGVGDSWNKLMSSQGGASSLLTGTGYSTGVFGYYAPSAGQPIQSFCKPNQFQMVPYYVNLTLPPIYPGGCLDNVIQPVTPLVGTLHNYNSNAAAHVSSSAIKSDPYCPVGDMKTTRQFFECVAGEANRNISYNNPWTTQDSLIGIRSIGGYLGKKEWESSNFCKNIVGFDEAKRMSLFLKGQGIPNDYISASRLVIINDLSGSTLLESDYGGFTYTPHVLENGKLVKRRYDWKGRERQINPTPMYPQSNLLDYTPMNDWYDLDFQKLLQSYQYSAGGSMDGSSGFGGLAICMDKDYKSNLFGTQWASHFQSVLIHLKLKGWIE